MVLKKHFGTKNVASCDGGYRQARRQFIEFNLLLFLVRFTMKRVLVISALCAPLFAFSAEITISCIGAESDDCPVVVDVNLDGERLVGKFAARPSPTSPVQEGRLFWCSGTTFSGPGWSSGEECTVYGRYRILNGELTKRQMADALLTFDVYRKHTMCQNDVKTGRPVCRPLP